jgi:hypothetical protein
VLAKLPANVTRGWPAAALAALLCAMLATGCDSGSGTASVTGTRSPAPGRSVSPSACTPWAGLDDLFSVTTWLRQMIGDEVIFGATTEQAKRDGLAVVVYAESLGGLWQDLPAQYARDLRDSVLPVAASPYEKTPEQLNAAANKAQGLAAQIGELCL